MVWENGWPRLAGGVNAPAEYFEAPDETVLPEEMEGVLEGEDWRDDFDEKKWNLRFQSLRMPLGERASLTKRPGWLRLYGKESLESLYEQSFLAARQQHFYFQVDAKLEFSPVSYQQMAGLAYYYDTLSHYYLCVTRDEQQGRVITVMCKVLNQFTMPLGVGISIPDEGPVHLRLCGEKEKAWFAYSIDGEHYEKIDVTLDATVLSDDYYRKISTSRFTGAFVGICCQDIAGRGGYADFDYFQYRSKEVKK